jgi:hypothetical protein
VTTMADNRVLYSASAFACLLHTSEVCAPKNTVIMQWRTRARLLQLLVLGCTMVHLAASQSISLMRVPRQQQAPPNILSVNSVSVSDSDGL